MLNQIPTVKKSIKTRKIRVEVTETTYAGNTREGLKQRF